MNVHQALATFHTASGPFVEIDLDEASLDFADLLEQRLATHVEAEGLRFFGLRGRLVSSPPERPAGHDIIEPLRFEDPRERCGACRPGHRVIHRLAWILRFRRVPDPRHVAVQGTLCGSVVARSGLCERVTGHLFGVLSTPNVMF